MEMMKEETGKTTPLMSMRAGRIGFRKAVGALLAPAALLSLALAEPATGALGETASGPAGQTEEAPVDLGVLTRDLGFDRTGLLLSLEKPFPRQISDAKTRSPAVTARAGSLVRIGDGTLYLLTGEAVAATRSYSPEDFEPVSEPAGRELFEQTLEGVNVLGTVDRDGHGDYALGLLPGGALVDHASWSDFGFVGQFLFRSGREIHLYQDGRQVATAQVARPVMSGCFGMGGFEIGEIRPLRDYAEDRPLIFSFHPLPESETLRVPEPAGFSDRESNLSGGEDQYAFEAEGAVDLDGDGVTELIVRETGTEGETFALYRHRDGGWVLVYSGGGYYC